MSMADNVLDTMKKQKQRQPAPTPKKTKHVHKVISGRKQLYQLV